MDCELLEKIYKDASMGHFACEKVLEYLKGKDNKIIGSIEKVRDEYSSFLFMCRDKLLSLDKKVEDESTMTKMMSSMGIFKEVISDNSDASMAEMLVQGLVMGQLEMEKRIKSASDDIDKEDLNMAKEFLKFQKKAEKELKKYL